MATLTLMGRSFEVAPLKLGALRRAAPFIDEINNTAGALTSLGGMATSTRAMIEVIAIALEKVDAALTADLIEDSIGLDEIANISDCFKAILTEAGLASKGEATAPSAPAAVEPEASPSSLDALSTS